MGGLIIVMAKTTVTRPVAALPVFVVARQNSGYVITEQLIHAIAYPFRVSSSARQCIKHVNFGSKRYGSPRLANHSVASTEFCKVDIKHPACGKWQGVS